MRNRGQNKLDARNFRKNNPWYASWMNAKQRCINPKHPKFCYYGGRGIKCYLTVLEIKELWFRDKAFKLQQPSINRIDNDGDYTFENCEFIEWGKNSAERNVRVLSKPVLQFNKQGKLIREWKSQNEAARQLNLAQGNIWFAIHHPTRTCGGFIWKFKA